MTPAKIREARRQQLRSVLAEGWEKEYRPSNFRAAAFELAGTQRIAPSDKAAAVAVPHSLPSPVLGCRAGGKGVPKNILQIIYEICDDKTFNPADSLIRIKRIAKGYAPMLTQVLEDYIEQNKEEPAYRKARIRAAKGMLGVL